MRENLTGSHEHGARLCYKSMSIETGTWLLKRSCSHPVADSLHRPFAGSARWCQALSQKGFRYHVAGVRQRKKDKG